MEYPSINRHYFDHVFDAEPARKVSSARIHQTGGLWALKEPSDSASRDNNTLYGKNPILTFRDEQNNYQIVRTSINLMNSVKSKHKFWFDLLLAEFQNMQTLLQTYVTLRDDIAELTISYNDVTGEVLKHWENVIKNKNVITEHASVITALKTEHCYVLSEL